jgi:hypothetical protein
MSSMSPLLLGDNRDVLRQPIKDASVELIDRDPPFKSNQDHQGALC